MNTILLTLALLLQRDLNSVDPLSTFTVNDKENLGYRMVNVLDGTRLAQRVWTKAAFPEDRRDRHSQNFISVWATDVSIGYRGRLVLSYNPFTGRLKAMGVSASDTDFAPNLSIKECEQKAVEYYRLVGGRHALVLNRSRFYPESSPRNDDTKVLVVMNFTAPGLPYRFHSGIEAVMDRTYGTPDLLLIGHMPEYDRPRHVISKDQAIAAAAAAAADFTGWTLVETGSQDAMFRIPDFRQMPNRLGPTHRNRIAANRAGLIYEATVRDGSVAPEEGKMQPFVQVFVDAETGKAIGLIPAYKSMGGPKPERRSFQWGSSPWSVGSTSGVVHPHPVGTISLSTRRVKLVQGKKACFARFDPESKLLWIMDGNRIVGGKPEAKLADAIARAKSIPDIDWLEKT